MAFLLPSQTRGPLLETSMVFWDEQHALDKKRGDARNPYSDVYTLPLSNLQDQLSLVVTRPQRDEFDL